MSTCTNGWSSGKTCPSHFQRVFMPTFFLSFLPTLFAWVLAINCCTIGQFATFCELLWEKWKFLSLYVLQHIYANYNLIQPLYGEVSFDVARREPVVECVHKSVERCHYTYTTQFEPHVQEVIMIMVMFILIVSFVTSHDMNWYECRATYCGHT